MITEKPCQNLLDMWEYKDALNLKYVGAYSLMHEYSKVAGEIPVMTKEQKKKNEEVFWRNKKESERTNLKLKVEFARFLSFRIYGYISCPKWGHEAKYRNIMRGEI